MKESVKKSRGKESQEKRPTPEEKTSTLLQREPSTAFPIVGIGASAGGLEAFTQLLKHLPVDTGMAFVLIQHLDPDHESELTRILARATRMPVGQVTNDLRVEVNRVYVIPPNASMGITEGVLKLHSRPQGPGLHRSIDFFFESLARDQRECAIGVILSGTATDGTLGLEAIKAEGGITLAQDESAKYDSMPRSAIAAGCVDFVLSPKGLAEELARIAKHPHVTNSGDVERSTLRPQRPDSPAFREEDDFIKILLLLRNHAAVDFSMYKPATIERRISRRMVLNRLDTVDAYARFLRGNSKELDALYSDLLINVSGFFRNPEAFEMLKQRAFPKLIEHERDQPLRIWVVGCSAGQEAYSLAMAFLEFSEQTPHRRQLQVFATDLNEAVLEKARHGLYLKTAVEDVSPERLRRFFVQEEGGYRVSKPLRDLCVFARQNLLVDPPFSRMDLVACRNVMIYLQENMQRKVVPTFHYALRPHGFLFLGASESIGPFTELFEPIDKKQKIYRKKLGPTPPLHLRFAPAHPAEKAALPRGRQASPRTELLAGLNGQREADRLTLHHYAPPGVLINGDLQILQFRGDTSPFLVPPLGRANFNVLKMAKQALLLPMRAAINKAKKEKKPVRKENVRVDQNGHARTVHIVVIPLKNLDEASYLILFEDAQRPPSTVVPSPSTVVTQPSSTLRRRYAELERELAETRDYLQTIQDQHEAANEELQASSEEATSANEELQSVNEELETSKEELESANEELTTVNEEMANRNSELTRLTGDLNNLHLSINTAILVVNRHLAIRRFTPLAEKAFNLLPTDVGRPLGGARHTLDLPDLEALVRESIDTVNLREREIQDKDGRWFSLRVRPYMTLDNKIDGAVLVLTDIDALKRKEQEIKIGRDYAEAILRTARDPLVVLNADLRVDTANEAFYETFKISPAQAEGRAIYELGNRQWDIPKLRELLEDILPRNSFFNGFEVTHEFETLGLRTMLLNARALRDHGGSPRILLGIQDVSELLQFQAAVRRSEIRYRRLFEAAHDGVLIIDPATRKIMDANPFMTELLGYTRDQLLGKELFEIGLLRDAEASRAAFRELREKKSIRYDDLPLKTKAGQYREVELVGNLYPENDEKVIQCNVRDISQRKRADAALRESEQRFRALFELGPVAVYSCDAAGVIREFNSRAAELWGRSPVQGDTDERFCGSFRLHRPDGTFMAHENCPMADVLCEKVAATHDAEVIIERPDHSQITVIVNIRPLKNEQGEVTGAINCFYDITERKRAEDALRASEERLAKELAATQQLQSASALLIEGGGADALYQKIVEAASAIMRSDMASMQIVDEGEDALRMLAWRGFPPEFGRIFALNRADSRTSCSVARREGHRVIVPDVETCDFLVGTPALEDHRRTGIRAVQSTPLFSRSGRLLGMISTHWRTPHTPSESDLGLFDILARQAADLIERKKAEEALRASEERYRVLFESSPHATFVFDAETLRLLAANQAALILYGYSEAEFLSLGLLDIRPREDVAEAREIVTHLPQSGRIMDVRNALNLAAPHRHQRKDGAILFVEPSFQEILFQGRRPSSPRLWTSLSASAAKMPSPPAPRSSVPFINWRSAPIRPIPWARFARLPSMPSWPPCPVIAPPFFSETIQAPCAFSAGEDYPTDIAPPLNNTLPGSRMSRIRSLSSSRTWRMPPLMMRFGRPSNARASRPSSSSRSCIMAR